MRFLLLACLPLLLQPLLIAQGPPMPGSSVPASGEFPDTYALGAGDQVMVRVLDVETIDGKVFPIDMRGDVTLPKIGRIHAAGLTPVQLQDEIGRRLGKYVITPDVSVFVSETRSQPVSVLGAVQTPGVRQLQGQSTLFEILSGAGGLRTDAGNTVTISRGIQWGRIPLPGATDDPTGEYSVASVNIKSVMSGSSPAENILILPHDVITVPKGETVYIVGAVKKPGGYVVGERASLSALQVLALAEGLDPVAAAGKAKIMRTVAGTSRRSEIPVDLNKILANRTADVLLQGDDVLFIPASAAKKFELRTIEALIQGSSVALYRVP